jgi:hypothetical protein
MARRHPIMVKKAEKIKRISVHELPSGVRRLEIPMHHAFFVGFFERVRDLFGNGVGRLGEAGRAEYDPPFENVSELWMFLTQSVVAL